MQQHRKQYVVFRIQDVKLRKQYVALVDSVRESGGDVKIFSSMHVSGERKLTLHHHPYFLI
jgi:stalled ribosome rescue protein Dom34